MPETGAADDRERPGPHGEREPGTAGAPGGAAQGQGQGPAAAHRPPDAWADLARLADQIAAGKIVGAVVPAWRRRTRGEQRWPVTVSVVVAIVLQLQLSNSLNKPLPHYLLPGLEIALGVGLLVANPVRIERRGPVVRAASIGLILVITAANAVSAILLVRAIVKALPDTASAVSLLASGASIWGTNVIAFGLWYWEFDRGGPIHRAEGIRKYPDLMFPQMASPELAPPDWKPHFVDYLYLSFTNATAFSPTDVMPLARWAKVAMAVQSAVSLAVGALVIARAVNILR
jgi:uncharacterized membrane protein